jgi:VWFA-related protein
VTVSPRRLLAATLAGASVIAPAVPPATVSAAQQPAAEPQPLVFGASADLVIIDLIATNDSGRLVKDLRPDEVEVYEEGKRQRVEFVRLVQAGPEGPDEPDVESPPSQATEHTNVSATVNLVVVVDVASMTSDVLARTRDAVLAMARVEMQLGSRIMLVSLDRGMHVRQSLTDEIERFSAAVKALPAPVVEAEASVWTLIDEVEEACGALRGTPAEFTPGGIQNAVTVARSWVENARLGMGTAYSGVGSLARYLGSLPGRKHVVFYSGGYPMDPSAIAESVLVELCGSSAVGPRGQPVMSEIQSSLRSTMKIDSAGMLHELLDDANRAQVSIYTVDARGLVGDAMPVQSRVPRRIARGAAAQQISQRVVRSPQEMLYSIAEGTGGAASLNTNELERGMRSAARDARGYYLLAYAPSGSRKEGRYYSIEVKLSRPGLRARYRRGYEWLSEARRQERALASALRFPGLYAEDGLALDPWIEAGKLNVAVILPTRSLVFRTEAGLHKNDLVVQGLLRDARGRMVGDRYLFAKTIEMRLPDARYADLRSRDNVEIATDAPAPSTGRYQIAVVLRHSGGRLASATADLVVP